ncbi:uncharacterized protein (TIGR02231 family) [Paucibacter oligotrophus]|uniref:Uncharacterized protein (TIGR02231 family) n=1 Tax=Roseateles oligotrophus TaxID=1769250 RepID=A0A840L3Z6_9BURK|nr:DUF4139 domain-containing protein [Roseateles oligotrophus]MBB4842930.1 uncharacterized protein (TIGR02231 family) [Roseateles oligotrophus]
MKKILPLSCTALAATLLCLGQAAQAQTPSTPSKITQVLVYPGGATVERAARVAAGSRELRLICLPERFDADSLQLQADPGIAIGEINLQTVEREAAPECLGKSPLDTRLRELEDKLAGVKAESEAQDLALGYLKNLGHDKATPAAISATLDSIKRSGQEALQRQHQLARAKQALEEELAPLRAERDRLQQTSPRLRSLQIQVAAQREGELRLTYRVPGAGWSPLYRAHLDTSNQQLRLERLAQVAQSSGEDWHKIKLRLSTSQPRQASRPNPLQPWTLRFQEPVMAQFNESMAMRAAPAPKAMTLARPSAPADANADQPLPNFDASQLQGEYAAEFEVPGLVSVASDKQRSSFALGSTALEAKLYARIQPQQEAQAYLLADAARPAGSWPSGSLQLYRDGGFIGQSVLNLGQDERLELFFGRDEMLRVTLEPEKREGANTGFIGARIEHKYARAYRLENQHKSAVTVQLLEAAPLSQHEDIKVTTQFSPKPTSEAWKKQAGQILWQQQLAPGQSQRYTAEYTVSYPKDAAVSGLR